MSQLAVSLHTNTPELIVSDPRNLPVRQVSYLRKTVGGELETLITRYVHNRAAHLIEQWDPRLSRPAMSNVHFLSGVPIKTVNVDAGCRVTLPGLASEELHGWDSRGHHWCHTYDDQLRVVAVSQNDEENVETFTYAGSSADPDFNLRGQMIRLVDQAGSLESSNFSLQGSPLSETRMIAGAGAFSSSRTYGPLGNVLIQSDAGGHQQRLHYDIAGQLKQVFLQLRAGESQCVLQDAQYNAAGQITMQTAGNGVISRWTYCPEDGRLSTLKSGKPDAALQQNLHYFYDRMGNILRIEDHTLTTVYFANQRVDGHRDFTYDSLDRLISASGFEAEVPHPQPGLPELIQPIDPGRRYGYTERFSYDESNNLTEQRHQRDGHNFTLHMRIDPGSNRGVRWKTDDPEPIFEEQFDPHGNQRYLQDGAQILTWNARDQLEKVTLLTHSNGLADDTESYLYSQGERVCKRHVTHTRSMTHSREVLYLPGLDIHTRDDGRVLHVITLPLAFGSVRCLHWASGGPGDLETDQLRYSLDDHLGSCAMELDRHGALISLEFYYAFGDTAWWAARSEVEADYKTIRYSGKEMDECGLYYYGARYYAPWLQRWVCADPAGDVDGLNFYAFVTNNPMRYLDNGGTHKEKAANQQLIDTSNTLSTVNSEMKKLNYQLYNLTRTRDIYKTAGKKLLYSVASLAATFHAGAAGAAVGTGVGSVTGPAAPVAVPVAAAVGGIFAAEAAAKVMDRIGDETGLDYAITPDPTGFSVSNVKSKSRAEPFSVKAVAQSFNPENSAGLTKAAIETTARVIGKHLKVPYLKQTLAIARQATQLTEALNDSLGQGDLDKITANLDALDTYLNDVEAQVNEAFETLAGAAASDDRLIGALNMPMNSGPVDKSKIEHEFKVARSGIKQARNLVGRVSQYLIEKRAA